MAAGKSAQQSEYGRNSAVQNRVNEERVSREAVKRQQREARRAKAEKRVCIVAAGTTMGGQRERKERGKRD
jgi:hypothetical protein